MTVKKQFAQGGGALDASMDQLVEALAQLLQEPAGEDDNNAPEFADLHSGGSRVIHVIENAPKR